MFIYFNPTTKNKIFPLLDWQYKYKNINNLYNIDL